MPEETPVREAAFPPSVISTPPGTSPETDTLEAIQRDLEGCTRCPLHENRRNIVFGRGNPQAPLVLVGEAPGRDEDIKGLPFVGEAGRLLDNILRAMELTREEVYICNVCKCRPPGNRNPKPEEIEACAPFLREQIRSIWPDVIVCLGNFATQFILKTELGVTKLRGRFHQTGHFTVMPTVHPAATIYHPDWLEDLRADMQMLGAWLAEHPAGE